MPDKNVTLTAQWTETDSSVVPSNLVKAKFFINLGGKNASKPDGTGTFTDGIEIQGAINLDVFNREKQNGSAYDNEGYIFNINGVETNSECTGLLHQKPEDTAINTDINAELPVDKQGSMDIGPGTSREVVWYHVSYCGDGYHVDGYIKNVAITITYNPDGGTFADGSTNNKTEQGLRGQAHTIIADIPTKNGYVFAGWKVEGDSSNKIYKNGESIILMSDLTLVAQWEKDVWTDADAKDNPSAGDKDSETGGDGIPDCDQVLIKYVSSNSDRGTVSPDMEVLTIRKDNKNVQIKINGSKATDNGGRNYFSNWTEDNTQVSTNATLNHQTILDVIKEFTGGKTYTFTANFGYSSGGGSGGSNRPKPPVVDIPDDVPTGLNGKDHYAYIIGYGNNDVRPQNNITRAEVATIFFRLLTDETREANMTKSNSYNDVKDGDWFCCAVSTLSKMGIIKGYEDGSFKPNDPISRAEFAAIAARFDPDGDKTPATFADVTSHWAKDEISIAANHGWIKGYEDGSFKPDQKITRAETMTLVNRVLNRLPEAKDDLHKDMKTWVDNMDETAWYYLAVQEATNSHYFKNKTGTKFEQWTDLRDTRDWSELEK